MKIIQLSTEDAQGGAAKACYRLAKGLRSIGENCEMLVKHKASAENYIHQINVQVPEQRSRIAFYSQILFRNIH